jgi:hypothetical protein
MDSHKIIDASFSELNFRNSEIVKRFFRYRLFIIYKKLKYGFAGKFIPHSMLYFLAKRIALRDLDVMIDNFYHRRKIF